MMNNEINTGLAALKTAIQREWGRGLALPDPGEKTRQYIDQFFSRKLLANKISGKNELGPLKVSCLWMLEHFKQKSGK
jgi:hypothetical protein